MKKKMMVSRVALLEHTSPYDRKEFACCPKGRKTIAPKRALGFEPTTPKKNDAHTLS